MNNTITSGYDLANELVKSEQPTSDKFVLAVNFLAYQYEIEQINGDDDNPFNPLVSDYQQKEEEFIAAVTNPTSSINKADPNLRTHWQLRIMKLYIIVDRQIDFSKEVHAPKEDFIEYLRVDSHNFNLQCDYMSKLHRLMDIQKHFNL